MPALAKDVYEKNPVDAVPGWRRAYAGYRFRRNFGDITLGFLNMTDQDYQLNPLNYYNELPRERTLVARVRLNF